MIAILLALQYGMAADSGAYPVAGSFEAPLDGPTRVDLPVEWLAQCPDPTSYLIVDESGAEVPYAVRTSDQHPPELSSLTWEPVQISRMHWSYLVHRPRSKEPVRALRIRNLPRRTVARVTIWEPGKSQRVSTLIWNLPSTGADLKDRVPLPPAMERGAWRVDIMPIQCWHSHTWVEFDGLVENVGQVGEVTLSIPADDPFPISATHSELAVSLPRAGLPVRSIGVDPEEALFSRPVIVLGDHGKKMTSGRFERVEVGGESIDQTRVKWRGNAGRRIALDVDDGRSPVLSVGDVQVGIRGAALLLPDVEAGRHDIYGCGPSGQGYDLDRVSGPLARQRTPRVDAEAPHANPAWTWAMVTDGLAAPGPSVNVSLFAKEQAVERGEGLVRVRLTPAVLASTRDGIPDLRFVTRDGRSVPHVLSTSGSERLSGVTWSQTEQGSMTRVRVDLPQANIPIERLVLRTERRRFERTAFVKADSETIAHARWVGSGEGVSRLVLELGKRVPETIWVELDNRDSLPLPILEPELSVAVSEAWLVAPAEHDVTMVYGSGRSRKPGYDLTLVRGEILDSPASLVALAGPVPVVPAPAPPRRAPVAVAVALEKVEPRPGHWVLAAVGVLSVALGGLALRLATEADEG